MLKFTRSETEAQATIKLDGALREPWVDEVRQACVRGSDGKPVALDLAALSYADVAGRELLAELLRDGAILVACSSFVAELLQVTKP
jgi:hypothetical protein